MTRVLITGSRGWEDRLTIARAMLDAADGVTDEIVIVHGLCPTGADEIADDFAEFMNWKIEAYPADWNKHGRAAGPIRNQQMVDLGADICLAFPLGESRGTRHCMQAAEKAGIKVINHGD